MLLLHKIKTIYFHVYEMFFLFYSIALLPAFYFLMPGKFPFLIDLFLIPLSVSVPFSFFFFQLNRARFTRKQRQSSLGVIIPCISSWNYRGQDKMFSDNIQCFPYLVSFSSGFRTWSWNKVSQQVWKVGCLISAVSSVPAQYTEMEKETVSRIY